jgi:hypothetical protein
MGDGIQITRVSKRFSSHTQATPPAAHGTSGQHQTPRQQLIEAMVEVIAEGSDPRLGETRAHA